MVALVKSRATSCATTRSAKTYIAPSCAPTPRSAIVSPKEQYETLRQLLRKELGVEPGPRNAEGIQELVK